MKRLFGSLVLATFLAISACAQEKDSKKAAPAPPQQLTQQEAEQLLGAEQQIRQAQAEVQRLQLLWEAVMRELFIVKRLDPDKFDRKVVRDEKAGTFSFAPKAPAAPAKKTDNQ